MDSPGPRRRMSHIIAVSTFPTHIIVEKFVREEQEILFVVALCKVCETVFVHRRFMGYEKVEA